MRKMHRNGERGISLVVALLALVMLSAVAIGMMFMSSTEAAVSANFKAQETAYFAARAGVEEVRDRMLPSPARFADERVHGTRRELQRAHQLAHQCE